MKILVPGSRPSAAAELPDANAFESHAPDAIALSGDGRHWVLLNASTALLRETPLREDPQRTIAAIVLLDARAEHVAGLIELRERLSLDLYATPAVFEELTAGTAAQSLHDSPCVLRWHLLPVAGDERSAEFRIPAAEPLHFRAVDLGGRSAPYSPHRSEAVVGERIALHIDDRRHDQQLFFCPDAVGQPLVQRGVETAP